MVRLSFNSVAPRLAVAGLFLLALLLRLAGATEDGLSHPEIYVPGIELVPGISEPPPRTDFAYALWWHFHDEPHPMGWYLAMFGWTELAGTSELALRLPAILLGAAAAPLAFLAGRHVFGPGVGMLAGLLLALHGFQIFWSQNARMYSAGVFLGLLATLLLLRLAGERAPRPGLEAAYVLTCLAGIQSVEMFWPLLLMQVAWVSLAVAEPAPLGAAALRQPHRQGPRLLQVQALALIVASPGMLHSAYRARQGAAEGPSLGFVTDYASFGFLMVPDRFRLPYLELAPALHWAIFVLGLTFLLLSVRARAKAAPEATPPDMSSLPAWLLPVAALAVAALMLWLASIAHRRNAELAVMSVLPLLAAVAPLVGVAVRTLLTRIPVLERAVSAVPSGVLLMWFLGVLAPLMLVAASLLVDVLTERSFTIFVPHLLVLVSAGILSLPGRPVLMAAATTGVLMLFAASVLYNARRVISPNDYRGLALAMEPFYSSDDLVLVRNRNWVDTPFFYYLPGARYVAGDYTEMLAENPEARVWLVTWPYRDRPVIDDERRDALKEYERIEMVTGLRAAAELFVPPGRP